MLGFAAERCYKIAIGVAPAERERRSLRPAAGDLEVAKMSIFRCALRMW